MDDPTTTEAPNLGDGGAVAPGVDLPDVISPAQVVRIGLAEPCAGELGVLYYLTLGQFVRAFNVGLLPIPPVPPRGMEYKPVYYTSRELRDAIGSELPRGRLGRLLRDNFHLSTRAGGNGYELLDVFTTMKAAFVLWGERHGPARR